jgi:hypothetical protein
MNKAFLRFCTLIAIAVCAFFSCKKTNSLNPLPTNNRLLNVVVTGSYSSSLGILTNIVNENYRFAYDNLNRVSKVYYTTNNITKTNKISTFIYSGDTVFDRIAFVDNTLSELDTFITDLHGHITKTYINGAVTQYSYFGNLLTRVDYPYGNFETYNSYNGNFILSKSSLGNGYDNNYTYYTDQANRIGDYLFLSSMFRYGNNLYQNSDLIRTVTVPGSTASLYYVIDGDSKITKTTAIISDTSKSSQTWVYNVEYEKY